MRIRRNGFTMVELIVVIVVIGILSTIGVSKFMDRETFDAPAYAQKLKSMVRYGQKLAIAQNRPVFVSVTANRVALCFDAGCTTLVAAPGGGNTASPATLSACGNAVWYCEAAPGMSVTAPAASMFFDAVGRPFAGTDALNSDLSTFTGWTVAVNGGAAPTSFAIERETGYVH